MAAIPEDTDSIVVSQAVAGNFLDVDLTLDGAATAGGVATFASPVQLILTIENLDGGHGIGTWHIEGTLDGSIVSEDIAIPTGEVGSDPPLESVGSYDTVTLVNFTMVTGPDARLHVGNLETAGISYNCACDDETNYETLAQLRVRLAIRLGFAAQASNLPPGMALLLNDFLISAQRFLYYKYKALRTERFFVWPMVVGTRFYDLPDNADECTKRIDPHKITWVGIEDLNGTWLPLVEGIPPEMYTSITRNGLPGRYEIRQCIEVFPAPDQEYNLRVKGHFGLETFAIDANKTTIDSELVFMWALANAKAHYGHPDANNLAQQANTYLGALVSGSHHTARYVPGTRPVASATQPVMLPVPE